MVMSRKSIGIGVLVSVGVASAFSMGAGWALNVPALIQGKDNNSANNPFVQPQDPALSGGGRDQSQQFGDNLAGGWDREILQGRLGIDLLFGLGGDDIMMGGTEHFNPFNRDRAFGGPGQDLFMWAPGDGSDFFDGGSGIDVLALGLIGEIENGQLVFRVSTDQQAGDVFFDPWTGLPQIDVTNSPGFCEIIDDSTAWNSDDELDALKLDHLVRFVIRSVRDDFEDRVQQDDNGLRVSIHLKDVEYVVCASRDGGYINAYDLRVSPPALVPLSSIPLPNLTDIVR